MLHSITVRLGGLHVKIFLLSRNMLKWDFSDQGVSGVYLNGENEYRCKNFQTPEKCDHFCKVFEPFELRPEKFAMESHSRIGCFPTARVIGMEPTWFPMQTINFEFKKE